MKRLLFAIIFLAFSTNVFADDPIVTQSTSSTTVKTDGKSETTIKSPPSSAISPSINSANTDLCTVAFSGAVQTQILGISGGGTVRDMNCERLKLSKTLYDMGMKVAAVSTLCQDKRIFEAMEMAGTPCPYDGKIGKDAKKLWNDNPAKLPANIEEQETKNDKLKGAGLGILGTLGVAGIILLAL